MGEGGYVRYDGITSDYLLGICKKLVEEYGGKITNLYKAAKDAEDLKRRLLQFRGVGPVTVNIFLREMRGIWPKAKPVLNKFTKLAMANLGLKGRPDKRTEVALLRLGKNYCWKKKCAICPVQRFCRGQKT